jgi:hypothetical protein
MFHLHLCDTAVSLYDYGFASTPMSVAGISLCIYRLQSPPRILPLARSSAAERFESIIIPRKHISHMRTAPYDTHILIATLPVD